MKNKITQSISLAGEGPINNLGDRVFKGPAYGLHLFRASSSSSGRQFARKVNPFIFLKSQLLSIYLNSLELFYIFYK